MTLAAVVTSRGGRFPPCLSLFHHFAMTLAAVVATRGGHFPPCLSLFHHFAMTLTAWDATSCLLGEVLGLFCFVFYWSSEFLSLLTMEKNNEIALKFNQTNVMLQRQQLLFTH